MAKKKAKKGQTLIIVESPNKVSSISKYAGDGYVVKASVGHIRELGGKKNKMGVDFRKGYEPSFQVISGKEPVVAELKMAAKDSDLVLIATDADREGEAIGWHVEELIKKDAKEIRRMTFTEITKGAIQEALKDSNLREINSDLVSAQIARQILDKIIGFKVSPILWIAIKDKLSAGRVQSVALRLIVEREREIEAFIPQEFWYIDAHFTTEGREKFKARMVTKDKDSRIWDGKEEVDKILKELDGATYKVSKVASKETSRSANAPFSTSTLQQAAGSQFGWSGKKTMEVAQKLYEGYGSGGFITYHRTDSLNIAKDASALARVFIKGKYGAQYVPKSVPNYAQKAKKKKAKKAEKGKASGGVQFESHEAIRPTNVNMDPSRLREPDHQKLYELIWRRFVSSQMEKAKFDQATIEVKGGKRIFRASGSRQLFDGWLKVWTYSKNEDNLLPTVEKGEEVDLDKLDPSQHQTKPPDRFTNSSIVKDLEEKGIGRPSTYANIIDTLLKRKYVETKGRSFTPTELGSEVCDHLLLCEFDFMDPKFTAVVEDALDDIAQGEIDRKDVIDLFYNQLKKDLSKAKDIQEEKEKTDFECPKCGRSLLLKTSRKGKQFFGCSGYSDKAKPCDNIMNVGDDGNPEEIKVEKMGKKCSKCGGDIVKRNGRFGEFYGCDNYPACRAIFDENGKLKEKKKPKLAGKKCTKCGEEMLIRKNRRDGSEFLACSGYPKCKNTEPIKGKEK